MRIPTKVLRIAVWVFFAAAMGSAALAAQPSKLLIAHGAISNNVAPLCIAKEQGIFKKYGLDVDLVFIIAGECGGDPQVDDPTRAQSQSRPGKTQRHHRYVLLQEV